MANKKEVIAPAKYFEDLKDMKNVMTENGMQALYDNCMTLLNEYHRSGQLAAQKKLLFHIEILAKEKQLIDMGVDTFIYKSDIDDFIRLVDGRVVKIIELENYQRRIPEDIIQTIEKCRGIFDQMYVLFTDYTGREERKIEAKKREKDPILFGTFMDRSTRTIVERFYFLGDWEDEYCDLTLDKMVSIMQKKTDNDIRRTISTPEDIEALQKQLENLDETMNGLYRQRSISEVEKAEKEKAKGGGFFAKLLKVFKG
jgi:hypothetical protein